MGMMSETDIDRQNAEQGREIATADAYLIAFKGESFQRFAAAHGSVRQLTIGFEQGGGACISVHNGANEWVDDFNLPAPYGAKLRRILFDE